MKTFLFLWLGFSGLTLLPTTHAAPGVEEVTAAAAGSDATALTALLDQGGPVNERNARGWTPLVSAVAAGRTDAVRALLARHAEPDGTTAANCYPLDFAVEKGHGDIVALLLDAGADINRFRIKVGEQSSVAPLFVAALNQRPAMAEILLARGARVNAANNDGDTPLMFASCKPCPEMTRLLLAHGADVNAHRKDGQNSLIYAAGGGYAENVRLLLAHGADLHATAIDYPGGPRYGVLETAQEQGRPYVLEILAEAGATPANPRGKLNEELGSAVQSDDYERAQAALAKGASATEPDHDNVLPITVAILNGNAGILRMLIKAGADVNVMPDDDARQTPLAHARYQIDHARSPQDKTRFEQVADILRKAGATR